jgi:hypothetical protein
MAGRRSSLNSVARLALVAAFLLALVFLLLSILWNEHTNRKLGPDLLRDAGIGIFVSVLVTSFIEWSAGMTLRREVAADVLEATFEKIVPTVVYQEVADNVFKSPVFRDSWFVDIRALDRAGHEELYREIDDDIVILDYTVRYAVENMYYTPKEIDFVGGIDLDVPLFEQGIPRFKRIRLTGRDESLEKGEDELSEDRTREILKARGKLEVGEITLSCDGRRLLFDLKRELESQGRMDCLYEVRRGLHVPGAFLLSTPVPAADATIRASGRSVTFHVNALHPDNRALRMTGTDEWKFNRVLLPWQGFHVRVESKVG